ncbi:MAG: energy transducer TonB [Bacteroidetes bacterium]|nr:energy transducer TonB [Bacteroidota bacterium]
MSGFLIKHKKGITGTLLFHVGLVLLFIFSGLTTPLPLPEEEGILINFGAGPEGEGLIEPEAELLSEPVAQPQTTPPETVSQPEESEEEIMTQDFEEAPAIESDKETSENQEELEALEKERKKEEELERQRLEKIDRERLEEQKLTQEITDRIRNALNKADNTATSEGETTGQGNQGSESGSVDTDNHSPGLSGPGDKGISYSLEGRTPQSLPKPEYNYQVEGKVVVEVTVDRKGNVTKATAGVKGSTTLDEYLLREAEKAALSAKFDRKPNAPAFQKGTITYYFLLQ